MERRKNGVGSSSELYSADREVRKRAAHELTYGLRSINLQLTHIFNTILLDKAIEDQLRRNPNGLATGAQAMRPDDAMVGALVEAVSSRYDLVERYYRLKRKLLGFEELFDYDRYAPVMVPAGSKSIMGRGKRGLC